MPVIKLARFFPFLNWPRPTMAALRQDAWAGISVGLVLVPQAVAYAALAGMPPQTGLYAALLPALIGILWGSSPLLAVGPVALTSLLVAGSLFPFASPGSEQWVALAIWLSFYSGLIQFLLGAFRLGSIASLVSQPVVTGFINAAAIIILVSQLPGLLAASSLRELPGVLLAPSPLLLVGPVALFLLLACKHYLPRLPGILLVTVLGIALSWEFDFAAAGVPVVGKLATGLPVLSMLPRLSFDQHRELLPAALIVALISFTEAMSSCRTLSRQLRQPWDENQELVGQGLAKLTSAFSGSFPVSGSFSRSALNLYAGAVSAWSTLFTTACVLFALLFLTGLLQYLPRPVLAAMIMVAVFNLLNLGALRRLFLISRDDGLVALVTFGTTLAAAPRLHWGVFTGVGLAMVSFLYRRSHPRIIEVSHHQDGTLRDRQRFSLPPLQPDLFIVRIDSALNFLTAAQLERFVGEHCRSHPEIRRVLLAAGSINDIDASGLEALESLQATLKEQDVALYLSGVKKQVWEVLQRAGFIAALGEAHFYATDREAIATLGEMASSEPE